MLEIVANSADIIGALGAVIAIGFAVKAQRDAAEARVEAERERRRLFDLEILRDLLEDMDTSDLLTDPEKVPGKLRRYRHRMLLLPEATLPFWRQMTAVTNISQIPVLAGMLDRIAAVEAAAEEERQRVLASGTYSASEELERFRRDAAQIRLELGQEIRRRMTEDIEKAIIERVEPGNVKPPRARLL